MPLYFAFLHKDDADRVRVELPDFPGCTGWAPELAEAPGIAAQLLADELHARRMSGEGAKRPMPAGEALAEAARCGAVPMAVREAAPAADRVSVRLDLPAGLVERVDRHAQAHGLGREDMLEKAARYALWEAGRTTPSVRRPGR